jgi:hypothetical protein
MEPCPDIAGLTQAIVAVIASEAIQLWRRTTESWIASSHSLLAMTGGYDFAISRRETPEL